MDNEILKKAAEYLKKGYTLTNVSCPKCNSPMFRDKNGNLICVVCGYSEIKVEDSKILEELNKDMLKRLKDAKDLDEVYKILKILYLIKKLKND